MTLCLAGFGTATAAIFTANASVSALCVLAIALVVFAVFQVTQAKARGLVINNTGCYFYNRCNVVFLKPAAPPENANRQPEQAGERQREGDCEEESAVEEEGWIGRPTQETWPNNDRSNCM